MTSWNRIRVHVLDGPAPIRWLVRGLLAATLTVGTLGGWWLLRPDLMLVERVELAGAERASEAELRHLADFTNGTTIWDVDEDALRRGVERHPWVRNADVRVVWPDRVVIQVEEFKPVALLHFDGLFYVSDDGVVFHEALAEDLDYPSITGVDANLVASHPDLPHLVVRDALKLINDLDTRGLVSRSEISEVHFSDARGFTVHAGTSDIVFGLDDYDLQLGRLSRLIRDGAVDISRPTHVDLAPASVAIVRPLDPSGEG